MNQKMCRISACSGEEPASHLPDALTPEHPVSPSGCMLTLSLESEVICKDNVSAPSSETAQKTPIRLLKPSSNAPPQADIDHSC